MHAQKTISLYNPSFEDYPRQSIQPKGWLNCGAEDFSWESPPDTQPGSWNVSKPASDGGSYLGMVVRDVETWEAVGQRLSSPLIGGKCYSFSIDLCRSSNYVSPTRASDNVNADYTNAVVLRIWGSNNYCKTQELLAETEKVSNTGWKTFDFKFEPKGSYSYFILEAFYKTPALFPYNGNLLLDNAQDIIEISCNEEEPVVAQVEKPRINQPKPKKEKPTPEPKKVEPKVEKPAVAIAKPKVEEQNIVKPKLLKELDEDKIRQGQIIRIKNLTFKADSSRINKASYEVLDEIFQFLKKNEKVTVEIGGHTNTKPAHNFCDMLSERRAKAVVDYLKEKGIQKDRLQYKGYGKRKPIDPYDKYNKVAQRKNQRVEIKILTI